MSRINHACGTCGHRAEVHADHDRRNGTATTCRCCRAGTFDTTGEITVEPTYDLLGAPEAEHYGPGVSTRWLGGGPSKTHTCDGCVEFEAGRTA